MTAVNRMKAALRRNKQNLRMGNVSPGPRGTIALCTASWHAIDAGLEWAKRHDLDAHVQFTCAQVNQLAGQKIVGAAYTGLTPADFVGNLKKRATHWGLPWERVIVGMDHGGPTPWKSLPVNEAMKHGCDLIDAAVRAGVHLVHLDPSPKLLGDDPRQSPELWEAEVAKRTVTLWKAAEAARLDVGAPELMYAAGADVPPPGGMVAGGHAPQVTTPDQLRRQIAAMKNAFAAAGVPHGWDQVVSLVVDHGADFLHSSVVYFDPSLAAALTEAFKQVDVSGEAHSTDVQPGELLAALVNAGFPTLKVGPELTYELRKALFDLEWVESVVIRNPADRSHLAATLEEAMLANPGYWDKYYPGTEADRAILRVYSLQDRIRYYWQTPKVVAAVERLFQNLRGRSIPTTVIAERFRDLSLKFDDALMVVDPEAIVRERIQVRVLKRYSRAAGLMA